MNPTSGQAVPQSQSPTSASPSASLLAANERLWAQRAAHGRDKPSSPSPPLNAAEPAPDGIWTHLPAHLGWESMAVTAVQRRATAGRTTPAAIISTITSPLPSDSAGSGLLAEVSCPAWAGMATAVPSDNDCTRPPTPPAATVCLPPSLSMALLRTGQTACGRLWLLLRHLDSAGCGCLPLTAVQTALTGRDSPLRLCGPRRLRQLLQQGNGLFWQRDKDYLWLAGAVKVAARLGVGRLTGRPVALPLAVLRQPIGLVRAHLYASFHSSRNGCGRGEETGQPISRAALTAVSGVSRRSQHAYEQRARVRVSRNIAIGPRLTPASQQAISWQQGMAVFVLADKRGQQGPPGRRYLAWQLPNSYQGPHARFSRGRNRRRNRQLADLCIYGDAGNGQGKTAAGRRGRRYVGNGATAVRQRRRNPAAQFYWRAASRGRRAGLWYLLAPDEGDG